MTELVDPVAPASVLRTLAPRPDRLEGVVALVDSMLNPRSLWGQGILDAVERDLARRYPDVAVQRLDRPQVNASPADVWAETMAARYAALVVAAGD